MQIPSDEGMGESGPWPKSYLATACSVKPQNYRAKNAKGAKKPGRSLDSFFAPFAVFARHWLPFQSK
jgi:hypothetical protein